MYISAAFVRGKKVSYWTLSALSAGQQQTLYQGPAPPPPPTHTHGDGSGGGGMTRSHTQEVHHFPKGYTVLDEIQQFCSQMSHRMRKVILRFTWVQWCTAQKKRHTPQKNKKKKRVPKTKWTVFLHPSTWLIEKNPTSFQLFLVFLKRKQVAGPGWYEVLQNCVSKHIWPADAPINF